MLIFFYQKSIYEVSYSAMEGELNIYVLPLMSSPMKKNKRGQVNNDKYKLT